jgi:hypothetical protein
MPDDSQPESRRDRLWDAAAARGVPLLAILATVAVVVAVYLAGKLVYKLREIILLMMVAGFIALLLNPTGAGASPWPSSPSSPSSSSPAWPPCSVTRW